MLPAKYKRSKMKAQKYETDAAAGLSLPRTGHLSAATHQPWSTGQLRPLF